MNRVPVTQEHGTGCAVACTAFVLGTSYRRALTLFVEPSRAWARGFYCRDLIAALRKAGRHYSQRYVKSTMAFPPGTIVYVACSAKYPLGHYLARTTRGDWMNPWSNFPSIAPAKSAFVKRLPGKAIYAILPQTHFRSRK